jgi:hypothetical protein
MQPRKLNLAIATYNYGGNGAEACTHPDVYRWIMETSWDIRDDDRIDKFALFEYCDTPITMVRNLSVRDAIDQGMDYLLMIDSDQRPDINKTIQADFKPFFKSSFDFMYNRYDSGPCCVGAPYCGPPPNPLGGGNENVYVFRWETRESGVPEPIFSLEGYTRDEARVLDGIKEVGALPTGLIMWDLRLFKETSPLITGRPWFKYEYTDVFETEKASTEDVYATREISLFFSQKNGHNPMFCNWDSWAGHWKPKLVGKPTGFGAKDVSQVLARAVQLNIDRGDRIREIDTTDAINESYKRQALNSPQEQGNGQPESV